MTFISDKYGSESTVFEHVQPASSTPFALKTSFATAEAKSSHLSMFQTILIGVLGVIVVFLCIFSIYVTKQLKNNHYKKQKLKLQKKQNSIREHIDSESYESLQSINMIPLDIMETEHALPRRQSVRLQSTQETTQVNEENRHEPTNICVCSDKASYLSPLSSSNQIQNGDETTTIVTSNNTYITVIEG
jgi:hypothetical protein